MKKDKLKLTDEQKKQCNIVIHGASAAAGAAGTGLAQIPLADNTIITPIQIAMIIKLGTIFGHKVTKGAASGIISSVAAAFVGRNVSQILVGWIPGVGNAVNTVTGAGITEAIGWLAVKVFSSTQLEANPTESSDNVEESTWENDNDEGLASEVKKMFESEEK
ncbi:MAG: GTP-binding protein [Lachnospiraceae bacterium]|nr:GTP-binding protein [Lachnospiraceae bacterium]